jgi:hypothetical protein
VPVYVIVWQFQVAAEHEEAFEKAYGPGGDWARLFGRSSDFQGTELLRAVLEDQDPAVSEQVARDYFTIDRWTSRDAYVAFNDRFAREYEELDHRFLELCQVEVCLGKFEVVE